MKKLIRSRRRGTSVTLQLVIIVIIGIAVCTFIGCGTVITKDTRIMQVTDTVAVPGKHIALEMPSDSIVYDDDTSSTRSVTIPKYKSYEEKLQEAREASRRAAEWADSIVNGQLLIDNGQQTPSNLPLITKGEASYRGFTAVVETTTQGVHLQLRYKFPADRWSVSVIERDTFATKSRMDTAKTTIIEKPVPYVPWWSYLTLVVIGGLLVFTFAGKFMGIVRKIGGVE